MNEFIPADILEKRRNRYTIIKALFDGLGCFTELGIGENGEWVEGTLKPIKHIEPTHLKTFFEILLGQHYTTEKLIIYPTGTIRFKFVREGGNQ